MEQTPQFHLMRVTYLRARDYLQNFKRTKPHKKNTSEVKFPEGKSALPQKGFLLQLKPCRCLSLRTP